MLYTLFMIVPFVAITLMISMPLAIKHNISGWLNVNIGRLHAEDFERLNKERLSDLRIKSFLCFLLTAAVTGLIGMGFIINGYSGKPIAVLICCGTQIAFLLVTAYPLAKKAKMMKTKIDLFGNYE